MKHIHHDKRDDPSLHEAFSLFPVNAAVGLHAWKVTTGPNVKAWTRTEVQVQGRPDSLTQGLQEVRAKPK